MQKKISIYFVGIIFSVIALIASVVVVILKVVKSESGGVGIGLA